ncbi:MAG TPA: DUF1775 domain-containing protein [Gaiellaceae bacterium]|jgi:hypothetical protein
MAAWGAVLLAAGAARAHVTVTPAFLEVGVPATVTFEAPNERDEQSMTALVIFLPKGVEADSSQPEAAGWTLRADARTATWSGGSLPPREIGTFALRLRASGEPRAVSLTASQRYPDGRSVAWSPSLTIVPAAAEDPKQYPGRALIAAVVGLVVIGASLVLARRLRQRSLQEE